MDSNNLHYHVIQEELKNLDLSVDKAKDISSPISNNDVIQLNAINNDISEMGNSVAGSDPVQSNVNRRFHLRPRKRLPSDKDNECDDLVNLYNVENKRPKTNLAKTRLLRSHLETIFEEPLVKKNGILQLVSTVRVKRSITFSSFITKTKQKKRKSQIKKLKTKIVKSRNLKVSLKDVKIKLDEITQV